LLRQAFILLKMEFLRIDMSSVNPATQPQDQLNEFTWLVQQFFRPSNNYGRAHYAVRLRNNILVRPIFTTAEDETCEDSFTIEEPFVMRWNLDGTSVTSRDYDMMEVVRND
jgi:hypothetical protein